MDISYISEIPEEYSKELSAAKTPAALRSVTKKYKLVAADADAIAASMDDETFLQWRKALGMERRGQFMGEENAELFGPILMPEIILKVSMVADQFKAPWGVAYHRLRDAGKLTVSKGVATMNL